MQATEISDNHGPKCGIGLTAAEVRERKFGGSRPRDHYEADAQLKEAIDQIGSGVFSPGHVDLFTPLVSLLNHDEYTLLADYRSYLDSQEQVDRAYRSTGRECRS